MVYLSCFWEYEVFLKLTIRKRKRFFSKNLPSNPINTYLRKRIRHQKIRCIKLLCKNIIYSTSYTLINNSIFKTSCHRHYFWGLPFLTRAIKCRYRKSIVFSIFYKKRVISIPNTWIYSPCCHKKLF